jgi:hypothetical protein
VCRPKCDLLRGSPRRVNLIYPQRVRAARDSHFSNANGRINIRNINQSTRTKNLKNTVCIDIDIDIDMGMHDDDHDDVKLTGMFRSQSVLTASNALAAAIFRG